MKENNPYKCEYYSGFSRDTKWISTSITIYKDRYTERESNRERKERQRQTEKETLYDAHAIIEAKIYHSLLSISWRPREACGSGT